VHFWKIAHRAADAELAIAPLPALADAIDGLEAALRGAISRKLSSGSGGLIFLS
jgi:hypothetical protein